jgi:hypothetical protein
MGGSTLPGRSTPVAEAVESAPCAPAKARPITGTDGLPQSASRTQDLTSTGAETFSRTGRAGDNLIASTAGEYSILHRHAFYIAY